MRNHPCTLVVAAVVAAGCGGEALTDPDRVRTWATTASPVAVYAHAHLPMAFADGQQTFSDPSCPMTTDDGVTVTLEGGCVELEGLSWVGKATVVRAEDGGLVATFDRFGAFDDPDLRSELTGVVERTAFDGERSFSASLVREGGVTTTIDYEGRVQGDYGTPTIWSGSGRVTREGAVEPTGSIDASTVDELVDDGICPGQPVSGETTLESEQHTVVVTYDGATDCDADQAARWSLNGQDQGLITGIGCSLATGSAPAGQVGLVGLLAAFAALVQRRRRRENPRAGGP